jgi:hypothetical protein
MQFPGDPGMLWTFLQVVTGVAGSVFAPAGSGHGDLGRGRGPVSSAVGDRRRRAEALANVTREYVDS